MKKISLFFILFFFSSILFADPVTLKQDQYKNIVLSYNGINPKKINGHNLQSKGLNNIVDVNGSLYVTSVGQNGKIVIRKVIGTSLSDFMVTDITPAKYNAVYSGAGSVCADNQSLYFSYIDSDNSISFSKIQLSSGSNPEWRINFKLAASSKYIPLDSCFYKNHIYVLVCEDEKNYHIIKISSDGSYKTINPPLVSFVGTKARLNAIAIANNLMYVYGEDNGKAYIAQYNLMGVLQKAKRYEGDNWVGAITRASSYSDKYIYFLYQYRDNASRHRIMRMQVDNPDNQWYKEISNLNTDSLHSTQNGIFVGYSAGTKTGFFKYDFSGNLQEEKFIINASTAIHTNIAYNSTLYMLSSLDNGDALFSSLPVSEKSMFVYNPDGSEYKDFAVTPNISFSSSGTFTYKIKYVNYQNNQPDSGFPKLEIYKNNALLSLNGYVMTEEDPSDKNYTDGKIYKYTINLDMSLTTSYSYRVIVSCKNEQFNSDLYYAPMFGDNPRIMYSEGNSYIFPDSDKFANTQLSAKMKFFEPSGLPIHLSYPTLTIYNSSSSLVFSAKLNSAGNNIYSYDIGALGAGSYTYTIEAKNSQSVSAVPVNGSFTILAYAPGDIPQIMYIDGKSHVYPAGGKYVDSNLYAKVKIVDPNNYSVSGGYPIFSLYNRQDNSFVSSAQMNLLGNETYHYNIGFLPAGKYKYKIEAKNTVNIEAAPAEGTFEVFASADSIVSGKIFNAPNPFNPAIGQSTKIVFRANGNESVKIRIYTLMGDKVFEDSYNAVSGTNEYEYKGKDNNGKMLYNGAYLCIVEKPSGNGKFKMLIIK